MVTFQNIATYLSTHETEEGEGQTMREFFTRIKNGNFLLDGIAVDVSPAELFRQSSLLLTHALYFRLQSVEPLTFSISAICFDGEPMEVRDFIMILSAAMKYIIDGSDHHNVDDEIDLTPIFEKHGQVDGGVLVSISPEDSDEELDVIGVCHPYIDGRVNRAMMYAVLRSCLYAGFSNK